MLLLSPKLFYLVREELLLVEDTLRSRSPIMRNLDPIGSLKLSPLEHTLRPAVVLLGARMFGFVREKAVGLAGMVQMVHLATHVHSIVRYERESESGSSSMPILLGDYFYSRFFALAAEAHLTRFLRPLSETVCLISASAIREAGSDGALQDVTRLVRNQTAELIAEGMAMGGELAGADPEGRESIRMVGLKLGMGYGLMDRGMSSLAAGYLDQALAELHRHPDSAARRGLQEVIEHFHFRADQKPAVTAVTIER
ncbi:MAG: polyprenyl synthetase family protein [Firmicutes bacterium]|nr:polyprenyl synthetase family protein [Bacillota bacterium]MBU4555181.1 polyprenyl synthetase family protein [Bacillota bacterium]MBV1726873.1 polyprenyl synthetase family protein [Desulforudis sp.]MBV1736046.1 polyprenyl synthetase family protein [Desulforudis sp.]MBV1769492.1 polyprenyl synthetase family protein [Desulforudis sp.]